MKTGEKKFRDWRKKFVTISSFSETENPDLTFVTCTTLLELSSKTQIAVSPLDSKTHSYSFAGKHRMTDWELPK